MISQFLASSLNLIFLANKAAETAIMFPVINSPPAIKIIIRPIGKAQAPTILEKAPKVSKPLAAILT